VPILRFSSAFRDVATRLGVPGTRRAAALIAVAALGLSELGLHVHFSRVAPTLEEWQGLKGPVGQLAGSGELVVVAPEWAEPNARFALGSELMPLGHVARPDASGFERALEISILGESAEELEGWRLERREQVGKFALRSLVNPHPMPVLYDFVAHVEPASLSVQVLRGKRADPCPYGTAKVSNGDLGGHPTFPRRRFSCPGAEWAMVAPTVIEDQNYRPRQCIWAHPANRGTVELHFQSVPLGTRISGYGALPYLFERESHGSPIQLEVSVAGKTIGTFEHRDGEGWKRFEFSTAEYAGQTQPVDFRVSSRQVHERQFCFQASVR
jgi:hypothetical protein